MARRTVTLYAAAYGRAREEEARWSVTSILRYSTLAPGPVGLVAALVLHQATGAPAGTD